MRDDAMTWLPFATKTARNLFANGATARQVAELCEITTQRAHVIRWQMERPHYARDKMRSYRAMQVTNEKANTP